MKIDTVRKQVADRYTRILERKSGCCGGNRAQKTGSAWANYQLEDLENVPNDAVSFGCGNPLAFSEVQPGQIVLDLGSGAGLDLLIASAKVGDSGKVTGVDMTDAMIAKARENIEKAGVHNVEVRKGYIEKLPVEDESVDWVISNCVINLSADKNKVFREIARVLKPGGRIAISDIVAESLPAWMKENQQIYMACVGGAISEKAYIEGLQRAGLEHVEVTTRLVYDSAALRGLIASGEVPGINELLQSVVGEQREQMIAQLLELVEGKVWSAKFNAEKS